MSESKILPLGGKVAIVTGASRGIGRGIALHLAAVGAKLVLNYASNSAQADQLAAEINSLVTPATPHQYPIRAVPFRANVAVSGDVKALFDHAEQTFGPDLHILVHCAGVLDSKYPMTADTTEEDWDAAFAVNAKGAFLCCREAARRLVRGGGGRIIALSSSLVGTLTPGYAAYTASKAAVEAMIRTIAKELKGTQITANCVAPGPVATDLFFAGKSEAAVQRLIEVCPMGRLGRVEDIAPVVGFLAGDASEWVNGQVIRANGGSV
ncbi:hypothetical protein H6P81_013163 [Aristolochia fimbriata]|uniref:Ketoreductase domain-containing protein n=1 Tax=Aristolochia fimbriata TaxID=158543 RepID=A0AAV7EDY1_ARIFI|nr:hypothetical protein H6P81_013163 [Aristolochia fimbriata]